MKKVLATLTSALLIGSAAAYAADTTTTTPAPAANSTFAVVNVQQIFQQSPKIAELNKKLQGQFKGRQEALIASQKTLQDEVDKFKKEGPTMSQKDKDALQKKIVDDQANLSKNANTFQQDLSKEQNKIMKGVLSDLSNIISTVAKKNNYTMVFDSQAVVYASDKTDITKDVAKAFDTK